MTKTATEGDFDFLTMKQKEVLDLLTNHRTSKEIAYALGLTETTVNRRIEMMKLRFGGITRLELARRYSLHLAAHSPLKEDERTETADVGEVAGVETTGKILQLSEAAASGERRDRDGEAGNTHFEDPVAMSIEAPWKEWSEPRIVPRVLDGENATLTRGAAIAILLFAIVASIVVALAAAKALADAVS